MKKIVSIVFGVICSASFLVMPFISKNNSTNITLNNNYKAIINVWQSDSFEGGTGSRSSFLRKKLNEFSKKHKGVLGFVTTYTIEGLKNALKNGYSPDVISIGGCGIDFSHIQKEIYTKTDNTMGFNNKKQYYIPWARGGYFYIYHDITKVNRVIIGDGDYSFNSVAFLLNNNYLDKKVEVLDKSEVILEFLKDSASMFVGTQRDIVKLKNRNVAFEVKPIEEYSDLYQYLSLTSTNENNEYYARLFIDYLLSEEVQKTLIDLQLFSTLPISIYKNNEEMASFEKLKIKNTISPFTDTQTLDKIKKLAKDGLQGNTNSEQLVNLLKQL